MMDRESQHIVWLRTDCVASSDRTSVAIQILQCASMAPPDPVHTIRHRPSIAQTDTCGWQRDPRLAPRRGSKARASRLS